MSHIFADDPEESSLCCGCDRPLPPHAACHLCAYCFQSEMDFQERLLVFLACSIQPRPLAPMVNSPDSFLPAA